MTATFSQHIFRWDSILFFWYFSVCYSQLHRGKSLLNVTFQFIKYYCALLWVAKFWRASYFYRCFFSSSFSSINVPLFSWWHTKKSLMLFIIYFLLYHIKRNGKNEKKRNNTYKQREWRRHLKKSSNAQNISPSWINKKVFVSCFLCFTLARLLLFVAPERTAWRKVSFCIISMKLHFTMCSIK